MVNSIFADGAFNKGNSVAAYVKSRARAAVTSVVPVKRDDAAACANVNGAVARLHAGKFSKQKRVLPKKMRRLTKYFSSVLQGFDVHVIVLFGVCKLFGTPSRRTLRGAC